MTGSEKSAIDQVAADVREVTKLISERVLPELAALTSRIEHPSPKDCVQTAEIEKNRVYVDEHIALLDGRINALEQWRSWILGVGAAVGVLLGLLGQRIISALWPAAQTGK